MSAPAPAATEPVLLNVYDLSQGMARELSMAFLGKQIDGIWHTGIQVYGKEYFYGGGIQALPPAEVIAVFGRRPTKVIPLGSTSVSRDVFHEWLHSVIPRYTPESYDLFSHNCNNFTDEAAHFLLGHGIPADIINLPNEVLATPMGQMLRPAIARMQNSMYGNLGTSADPFANLARTGPGIAGLAAAAPAAATPVTPAVVGTPGVAASVAPVTEVVDKPLLSLDSAGIDATLNKFVNRAQLDEPTKAAVLSIAELLRNSSSDEVSKEPDTFTAYRVLDGCQYFIEGPGEAVTIVLLAEIKAGDFVNQATTLMAYAVIANLFYRPAGAAFLLSHDRLAEVLEAISFGLHSDNDNRRQLAAALAFNLALNLPVVPGADLSEPALQLTCAVAEAVVHEKDAEARRRQLATLMRMTRSYGSHVSQLLVALGTADSVRDMAGDATSSDSVREAAKSLSTTFEGMEA